jgi:iron(III) transport system ATP-binding protein
MPVLQLKNIGKKFPGANSWAVRDFDLNVEKGEIIGLVGESGCGKTTILRLIAGFEKPTQGSVYLHDELVAGENLFLEPQKRRVGIVFQDYALFPHKTVKQNIYFGMHRLSSQKAEIQYKSLMGICRLEGLETRYPHQLSGGQKQRVALARALAPKPDVILFDEPFSNLDTLHKNQMRAEIGEIIRKTGATAILVTHDTRDVLALATRAVVMKDGLNLQDDQPGRVYFQPANAYVARFFGAVNLLPGRIVDRQAITAIGNFPAPGSNVIKGPDVLVCLRPEEISFCDQPGEGVPVKVLNERFLGEYTAYTVMIGNADDTAAVPVIVNSHKPLARDTEHHFIRPKHQRPWFIQP